MSSEKKKPQKEEYLPEFLWKYVHPNIEPPLEYARAVLRIQETYQNDKLQATAHLAKLITDYVDMRTLVETEEILWYNEEQGIWKLDGEKIIKRICRSIFPKMSGYFLSETISKVQTRTYTEYGRTFGKENHLIVLKNGVYDLKNFELINFDPKYYLTHRLDIAYNPKADCPNIKKFMTEIVDEKYIKTLEEIIGYCLYPGYHIHKAFMFVGDGSNGKSTFISLIECFLGEDNISNVELQDIAHNRFSAAELEGKMANLSADLKSTALNHTGKFKALTGGDRIMAERKFGHPFNLKNKAKLVFSCNEIPTTLTDESIAYYRRWLIVPFPNTFEENAQKQNELLDKLTSKEELQGLFVLALESLRRLLDKGRFEDVVDFEAQRRQYILESDTVKAFVLEECIVDPEEWCPKKELYKKYEGFCRRRGKIPRENNIFGRELKKWAEVMSAQKTIRNSRARIWKGITHKEHPSAVSTEIGLEEIFGESR